jgi:CBS domain-containing protein
MFHAPIRSTSYFAFGPVEKFAMKIKDRPEYKTKAPTFTLAGEAFVSVAVKTMAEKNYGSVVIVDGAMKVKGIVTERDLLRRLLNDKLNPDTTKLSDIMTRDVKCANADDDMIDWLRQMSNERFRHVPVVDADGTLITMMSQGDFVSYTWPDLLYQIKEKTRDAIGGSKAPLPLLIAGIMVYTIAILFVLKSIIGDGG